MSRRFIAEQSPDLAAQIAVDKMIDSGIPLDVIAVEMTRQLLMANAKIVRLRCGADNDASTAADVGPKSGSSHPHREDTP